MIDCRDWEASSPPRHRYLFTRASVRPIPAQVGLIWATKTATHMMAPMPFFWYTPNWAGWKWSVTACSMVMIARIEEPARNSRSA